MTHCGNSRFLTDLFPMNPPKPKPKNPPPDGDPNGEIMKDDLTAPDTNEVPKINETPSEESGETAPSADPALPETEVPRNPDPEASGYIATDEPQL